ncbi:flagellar hook-length control protein FliK [Hyalangium rubrum]|uniref:Flagellar hook-length control protein FliK n=1 Tax=Hyalangium rubrum TaxID=3103134 RepID=A0ABU5GWG0_9BACT|nr:flagellar hook-length control protein FliK [Hyalangium sp. s54d21]MDY7225533.1 flagellar hook-length control protein FliK [Hyalangium sp. s54d21]
MSRVEDDRQAERATQRLVQEKQLAEAKGKQRKEGEAAFSKLMQQPQEQKAQTQKQDTKQNLAQSVLARALKESGAKEGAATKQSTQRQEAKSFDERVQAGQSGEAERMTQGRQTDSAQGGQVAVSRKDDQHVTETRAESRDSDSKADGEASSERNASAKASSGRSKGELKTDADSGGGQGGGNKDNKQGGEAAAAAGFRFNPALMAPVPVAKPKPNAGSDRLRAIANEIAQKIVERVRVGTNGAGAAEFQIDLRSDVLKGLSIKLSAKNGKISAVFSGSDRDVLKMIEEQSEGLKSALTSRGLKLETLRFEARA